MTDSPIALTALMVFVHGLAIEAEIGVYPSERGRAQPLIVDVELVLEPGPVGALGETVNYETLATAARDLAGAGHIELVETYAERLAGACLAHARARRVRVRVRKPQAIAGAEDAGVEVSAERG